MDELVRKEIVTLLNEALRLEHSAAIQYGGHAESVAGLNSSPIISLLKDSAADEVRHQDVLRGLIGDYLFDVPALDMTPARPAVGIEDIIKVNIASENEAIALYKKILTKIYASQADIAEIYERLEHDVRHILMEEQEHSAELYRLLR